MNLEVATSVIDEYADWIKDNMKAVQQGDAVRIVGPMLDRHNDCMALLMIDDPEGGYILTDLGETIGDLEFSGINILNSERRATQLSTILNGFGVTRKDGEIFIKSDRRSLVTKMHMLFQAMASVDDFFLTSRENIRSLFAEDVRNWMFDNDIRAVESPSFTGRSGLMYRFDFAIAASRKSPERLIKTVNTPNLNNVRNALFGWTDIEEARMNSKGYLILNETSLGEGGVSSDILTACRNYGINPIRWGVNQDRFVEELAA